MLPPPPPREKGQKDLMDEWSPCGLMGRGLFDFLLGRGCSVSRALHGTTFELLCDDWHGSVIRVKPPPKWGRGQSKTKNIGGQSWASSNLEVLLGTGLELR